MSTVQTRQGKFSAPGKGNIYAKANEVIVKINGGDTDNTFEVVEENCKPGFQSRAHYHIKAYETFYVFEGSADFQVGDEVFHATKGSCVHIPPGVPHQLHSHGGPLDYFEIQAWRSFKTTILSEEPLGLRWY